MTLTRASTEVAARLRRAQHPLLLAHPRPDGDTVGSALALRLALLRLGQSPVVACVDPLPETFAYLPGYAAFVQTLPDAARAVIDLVVAIDQSDIRRTGGLYPDDWRGKIPLIVIDHHATNAGFGDANVIDPEAVATAVVLLPVLEALEVPVVGEMATCLLTGILTDTRGLRTPNVTAEVLRLVARLVDAGGEYTRVMEVALESLPLAHLQIRGRVLSRLQMEDGLAWSTLPLADKLAFDVSDYADLELGNLLSQVRGAHITAAFVEMRDGSVRVSLRARAGYDVSWVAAHFGGGGHHAAAGCTVAGPPEAAVAVVLPRLREALTPR